MKRAPLSLAAGSSQAFEDGAKVEPSIEQILDLPEIAMRVLPESEGVAGAGQCDLGLPKAVLTTARNDGCLALAGPPPGTPPTPGLTPMDAKQPRRSMTQSWGRS